MQTESQSQAERYASCPYNVVEKQTANDNPPNEQDEKNIIITVNNANFFTNITLTFAF